MPVRAGGLLENVSELFNERLRFDRSCFPPACDKDAGKEDYFVRETDAAMAITDILIWESSNLFLLIPAVIGLLMLRRWIRGWPVFTDRDWIFLIGHPREKLFSLHLWLKLGMLWFTVVSSALLEVTFCFPMDFHCSCARFLSPGL